MFRRLVICALIPLLLTGCSSSKWAIEDPVYAEKYERPYEDGEKLPRMAKQIVDARHLANRSGTYVAGAYRDDPRSQAGSIGAFSYGANAATSSYLGGNLSHTDFDGETLLGLETGTRIQAPSRLAPFAGAGATGGASADAIGRTVALVLGAIVYVLVTDDDDDHDHDSSHHSSNSHTHDHDHDDDNDWRLHYSPFAAVYPEVGVHYWVTHDTRLTFNARYMVTTEGRDHDFWLFGLSLGFLKQPGSEHREVPFEPVENDDSKAIAEILAARWEAPAEESDGEVEDVFDQPAAEIRPESQPEQSPDSEQPQRSHWARSWTDPKNTDAARHFLKSPQFHTRPE